MRILNLLTDLQHNNRNHTKFGSWEQRKEFNSDKQTKNNKNKIQNTKKTQLQQGKL